MPELPEVETIRGQLSTSLIGAEFLSVTVRRSSCYAGSTVVVGERIRSIVRVGKYLYLVCASGNGFCIHLKMNGRLVLDVLRYAELPHTRVILHFRDGRRLYFWDSRTFGYVKFIDTITTEIARQQSRIGPEPWQMSAEAFYTLCQRFGRPIKNLILDQALIAGVGNIYANDALWEASIDPRRVSRDLSRTETTQLLQKICFVLERGLKTGGASDNSYVDGFGQKGSYQKEFRVYRRTREPCLRCGTLLKRIVVGGRGTWVCERCQV
jgi:formamidopyrimidine-DNA glycosylase